MADSKKSILYSVAADQHMRADH